MVQATIESLPKVVADYSEEASIRVLHVDDEASFLKAAKQILEMQGNFQVDTAVSVKEALKKMKKKTFDVIVSDYQMPEKNGLEFLRELRNEGNTIPFIMFTGKGREEVAIEALNYGADQYLNKDGDPETVYSELAHSMRKVVKAKKAEEALEKAYKRLDHIIALSPIVIYTSEVRGDEWVNTFVSENVRNILGYEPRQFTENPHFWIERVHPDDIEKLHSEPETNHKLEDGRHAHEFRFLHKDGSYRWMLNELIVRTGPDGKPLGCVGYWMDISERKQAETELKKALEKLEIMNEKLNIVGKLTRHDARNKLSTVIMNVFLARQKLAGNHEALQHLDKIESTCKLMEKVFDFARIYEVLGVEELVYKDVERIVGEAFQLFPDVDDVKFVNDCRGLTVLADSLLRQLFYNLIDNSLRHGKKVSRIRVYYEKAGKDKLKLVYEDDGVGIAKAEKEKIFMEGYGKGTGYGMYLVRKMCEVYGWTIRETGKQGKGAQFTITIPKNSVRIKKEISAEYS